MLVSSSSTSLVEALAERRAQVSQLATENILSSSNTCYLAALPDELKEQVLVACFEPRDMAALARCSREFAALLREDNVWSMLVERRWPHLAWAPVAPHSRTPSLDLHRERAHVGVPAVRVHPVNHQHELVAARGALGACVRGPIADRGLDELSRQVRGLHNMGTAIGDEIRLQDGLLDQLGAKD